MKTNFILALAVGLLCASCSNESETTEAVVSADEDVTVALTFSPYEVAPMSRALASIGDYCTKLDVWVMEGGNEVASFQQETGDNGFGSISLTLNVTKEYTIYAVAHRVTSGHATLSDGIISFADDKVTHTFFYSNAFTPTKGMSLNCEMQRIVAQFSFNTTDAVPDWCKTIRFTINGVFDRWNVAGYGVHELNRVSNINITSTNADGTVTCNIYAIVTDASTTHDILVEALDAQGAVQESHTLADVPLRNGYRTVASGYTFTDAASAFTFKAEDWAGELSYDF